MELVRKQKNMTMFLSLRTYFEGETPVIGSKWVWSLQQNCSSIRTPPSYCVAGWMPSNCEQEPSVKMARIHLDYYNRQQHRPGQQCNGVIISVGVIARVISILIRHSQQLIWRMQQAHCLQICFSCCSLVCCLLLDKHYLDYLRRGGVPPK